MIISLSLWAAAVVVQVSSATPRAELRGELAVAPKTAIPQAIELRFQSPPRGAGEIPKTAVQCDVNAREFRCAVPAATLDIRLSVPGFAPVYAWDVDVAQSASLGTIKLVRGASVSGWLSRMDEGKPEEAVVELVPENFGQDAALQRRLALRSHTAKVNARGFYQFRDLEPGTYSVMARAKGATPARAEGIRVAANRELVMRETLVLNALAMLTVAVQPPVNPESRPWHVRLERLNLETRRLDVSGGGLVAADGRWLIDGLEQGRYRVSILDDRGAVAGRQEIEVVSDAASAAISITCVPIEGHLRIGEEPLPAKLMVESSAGSVTLEADERGQFGGWLPAEGDWRVRIAPAKHLQRIALRKVPVHLSDAAPAARVDITLPGGRIEGSVRDETGAPVVAEVLVLRNGNVDSNTASDRDGVFSVIGLAPGEVSIEAVTPADGAEADPVHYRVAESVEMPVTLTVHQRVTIRGQVVRASGAPVAGALLRYQAGVQGQRDSVTGPTGNFEISVPKSSPTLDIVIVAPGLPVKIAQLTVKAEPPTRIVMQEIAGRLTIRLRDVPPWPLVRRDAAAAALFLLFYPRAGSGPPREWKSVGEVTVEVEAGQYAVCVGASARCVSQSVSAGGEAIVDATGLWPSGEAK
ncbi:MAG TPA: carboxypeptidase-like regulatory domain-containing protein [Thermoanaerobaculia bacterium]|nr:carboxypeptidase-like regulatory domain-containing protein [Thermoanaerobaculia bacterium]